MKETVILIGSVTYAMKAKKLLAQDYIKARIFKTDSKNARGCHYALRLDSAQTMAAVAILRKNGISYEIEEDGSA